MNGFNQIGTNRNGLPVFGRSTTTISAEKFNGMNLETGKPRFMPCTTIVRYTAKNTSRRIA